MNEKISELIDDELDNSSRDALLDHLSKNKAETGRWLRYHLIGNVIRNETAIAGKDMSVQIMEKLESEATILAPGNQDSPDNHGRADIFKSAGMFAIAASLALVAVISLRPVSQPEPGIGLVQNTQVQESAVLQNPDLDAAQFSQEFDEMLAEHGEFTASSGLNGLVAYAKLVSNQKLDQ